MWSHSHIIFCPAVFTPTSLSWRAGLQVLKISEGLVIMPSVTLTSGLVLDSSRSRAFHDDDSLALKCFDNLSSERQTSNWDSRYCLQVNFNGSIFSYVFIIETYSAILGIHPGIETFRYIPFGDTKYYGKRILMAMNMASAAPFGYAFIFSEKKCG